mmetsp:Transcript_22477/g.27481  ORF Transcript_22477/g.27481 Transcript_22477/m.27481 type:complete len:586 (-) Transcript_22477:200-1957(-)
MRKLIGRSVIIAFLGSIGPISLSYLTFAVFLGEDVFPSTMSAAFALAPTSIGLTTRLLLETRQFQTLAGQTILTASFIDDIIGLSLFLVLITIASGELEPYTLPVLLVYISILVFVGIVLAVYVFPRFHKLLMRIKERPQRNVQLRDELLLAVMVVFVFLFGWIGAILGSELIGTFVAGMSFSTVSRARFVWRQHTINISQWLLRLFFGATVAFSIPVDALIDLTAFWNGLIVVFLPILCGKLLCSLAAKDKKSRWIIGFAMVTRGEFGFIIAETAQRLSYSESTKPGGEPMMSERVFSSLIWGLVLSMFFIPFVFKRIARQGIKEYGVNKVKIEFTGKHHTNILYELQEIFRNNELEVLAATVNSDGDVDNDSFVVHLRGGRALSADRINRLKRDLNSALQWNRGDDRINVSPIEPELEIAVGPELKAQNSVPEPDVDVTETIDALDADVNRGPVNLIKKVDSLQDLTNGIDSKTSTWLEIKFDPTDTNTDARNISDELRTLITSNGFLNQQLIYDQGRSRIYLLEDSTNANEQDDASIKSGNNMEERVKILQIVHDFLKDPGTTQTWKISTNFDADGDTTGNE